MAGFNQRTNGDRCVGGIKRKDTTVRKGTRENNNVIFL